MSASSISSVASTPVESISTKMSTLSLIAKPLTQIQSFLSDHNIEMKLTSLENTYIIKFTEKTNVGCAEINHLKGLIFNHSTGEIVSLTYPVPHEIKDFSVTDRDQVISDLDKTTYRVEEAVNGTLLRYAFNSQSNQWILSTNNKEDANQAFWMNNVSLAQQFHSTKGVKIDPQTFNKDHVHMFVMCHPLNIIVVNHCESKVYHVATYDRSTFLEIDCDLGMPKPPQFELSVSEVYKRTQAENGTPVQSAGYMIISQKGDKTIRHRFENRNYTRARELRGQSCNINFTLLDLHFNHPQGTIEEFLQYYPIYSGDHTSLLNRINQLTSKLYKEYGLRYKAGANINVHSRHHKFLIEMHHILYKETLKPVNRTMQYNDVNKFLVQQPTGKLLYLLDYIRDQ
jgi:hypothetical protein